MHVLESRPQLASVKLPADVDPRPAVSRGSTTVLAPRPQRVIRAGRLTRTAAGEHAPGRADTRCAMMLGTQMPLEPSVTHRSSPRDPHPWCLAPKPNLPPTSCDLSENSRHCSPPGPTTRTRRLPRTMASRCTIPPSCTPVAASARSSRILSEGGEVRVASRAGGYQEQIAPDRHRPSGVPHREEPCAVDSYPDRDGPDWGVLRSTRPPNGACSHRGRSDSLVIGNFPFDRTANRVSFLGHIRPHAGATRRR